MKKAFIYVGHANWGKSFALKQITNGSSRKKTAQINDKWVWVRKMSNDDDPAGLLAFSKTIPSKWYENFILAYCPNHEHDQGAMDILNTLQESCELYFFIQEIKFSDPSQSIPETEISFLRQIGTVQILPGHNHDTVRAEQFLSFIKQHI
ncbi:hypothetical protein HNS38_16785 [Lentimicrobium sp. L6]|uniref:hypothetical protein n=1 Tax=Lentimicrobium sp. L6 TaxID=2735916 RepID=UPI00155410D2|nr:hypothetical protein [Lentimicrobium sp. L6]NPD86431.1 hypothetical protein [Lentimicrobium sp. L6]